MTHSQAGTMPLLMFNEIVVWSEECMCHFKLDIRYPFCLEEVIWEDLKLLVINHATPMDT